MRKPLDLTAHRLRVQFPKVLGKGITDPSQSDILLRQPQGMMRRPPNKRSIIDLRVVPSDQNFSRKQHQENAYI